MASRLVIKAALELLRKNLIVRTWGNISARISENEFVITPSGKGYEDMVPEDLVTVRINDLSYEGNVKPSSEKGIHAGIYLSHPEVNFVIHTHQFYASAICAAGKSTDFAPCAGYGLPGQKKLCEEVIECVKNNPNAMSILMSRHGAIAFGEDYEQAMEEVLSLEEKCESLYKANKQIPSKEFAHQIWLDDYAQLMGLNRKAPKGEDPEAVKLVMDKNFAAAGYVYGSNADAKPLSIPDVLLQNNFYKLKYSKLKR